MWRQRGPQRPAPKPAFLPPTPLPGVFGGEAAKAGALFSFTALFLVWEMLVAPSLICAPGSTVSEWVSQCPLGNSLCVVSSLGMRRVFPRGLRGSGGLGFGSGRRGGKKTPAQGCHARRSHSSTWRKGNVTLPRLRGAGATPRSASELRVGFEPCSWGSQASSQTGAEHWRVDTDEEYSR